MSARTKTLLLLGALGMLALIFWMRFVKMPAPEPKEPGPLVNTPEPKIVERVKRVYVPGPERIIYLEKEDLSAKLEMPELKKETGDPIAVARIPPHRGPTTAIAVLDNTTGETRILARQEPLPFLEWKKEFRLQGRYLFSGANMVEADFVVNPLRIGPVELEAGAGAEIRRGDDSIGARGWIGASYRF